MTTKRNALDFPYLQGNVDLADVDLESAPPFQLYGNIVAGPPEGAAARLCGYFERACDARPSSTALECDGESLSYADLDRRANRLANYLIGRGVRAGARVGILLDRSVNTYPLELVRIPGGKSSLLARIAVKAFMRTAKPTLQVATSLHFISDAPQSVGETHADGSLHAVGYLRPEFDPKYSQSLPTPGDEEPRSKSLTTR
jgi:non-ribosomal peptide synthetase component F